MNLDLMNVGELLELELKLSKSKNEADKLLAKYCVHRIETLQNRSDGNIVEALFSEKLCDIIYRKLPSEYRW